MSIGQFFELTFIKKDDNIFTFEFFTNYQSIRSLPHKETIFYKYLSEKITEYKNIDISIYENSEYFEENYIITKYSVDNLSGNLYKNLTKVLTFLDTFLNEINCEIEGLKWKDVYLKNESLFTIEMVIPLLKKLGFKEVQYNHGVNEFGKDIIFSKYDEFGEKKFSAVQVKAGDISGKVNGKVDEIIQQIDDAFKIPFQLTGSQDIYISSLIVIISGKYTNNAKEKIRYKISKTMLGSLTFLDRESIINLIY